ncbi:MAG: PTS lactose/cellobiose transporter subunit IIA [Atopobiaceae bacterium]|jgi:PTS system lactose-specific IIA component|nr:PTS lactose/cellobiose transporter subunit IIA [Atopobiaceae bacterium]MCH4180201.1 PTS lactose/cellobiose transporter subunit IIA [Atopobiaceae bacterium]MCH4214371.1 PTS lactose/cellobiose transporter subunit IIA [Atopobiaceae bacterium]MCH4229198.1 PTS lactose/cellobiose transporter subunit IIA [Atopobiaceae bacterium]MCH4276569.1 PTS lactose/cellobiose transporter subunit IIA [Atopobiaceae bacterium]
MTKEEIQQVSFEIVAYSGDARTKLLQAVKKAKTHEFDESAKLIDAAQECINEAHKSQTTLLQQEAAGENNEIGFITVHAQDHLMTTMMLRDIVDTLVDVYR